MKTKIILEIGYNHQGDIELAKKMIDEAAKLKIWGVKFQKWDVEGIPENIKNKLRNDKNAFGKTYYEHRKALEFSISQLKELKEYTENKKLKFACSGKDFRSIKLLVENLKCKYIKLPSQRYKDHDIYLYLMKNKIKRNLFIMVSTGMHLENEIPKSRWTTQADVRFHCISDYPAKLEQCDFAFMRKIEFYNGYSSHEKNGIAVKFAVALGAEYIERHFTLDKTAKGTDNAISSDVKEMKKIINEIQLSEKICGDGHRHLSEKELLNRNFYKGF